VKILYYARLFDAVSPPDNFEIVPVGPVYGDGGEVLGDLTPEIMQTMITNRVERIGYPVLLDAEHGSEIMGTGDGKAYAWVGRLAVGGPNGEKSLWAYEVAWTPLGIQTLADKLYRGISIAFNLEWQDPRDKAFTGPMVTSVALTNNPRVVRMKPLFSAFKPQKKTYTTGGTMEELIALCKSCAEACLACANDPTVENMKACLVACEQCAKACRDMFAMAPETEAVSPDVPPVLESAAIPTGTPAAPAPVIPAPTVAALTFSAVKSSLAPLVDLGVIGADELDEFARLSISAPTIAKKTLLARKAAGFQGIVNRPAGTVNIAARRVWDSMPPEQRARWEKDKTLGGVEGFTKRYSANHGGAA